MLCVKSLILQWLTLQLSVLLSAHWSTLLSGNGDTTKGTSPVPGFVMDLAEVLLNLKEIKEKQAPTHIISILQSASFKP